MTASTTADTRRRFTHRCRWEIGFIAASIVWAAVIIDTGDIAWPLAMWMATALGPLSLHRRSAQTGH